MKEYLAIHSIQELKDLLGLSRINFLVTSDGEFIEDMSLMSERRIRIASHIDNKLLLGGYIVISETLKATKSGKHEGETYTEYILSIPKPENTPVAIY